MKHLIIILLLIPLAVINLSAKTGTTGGPILLMGSSADAIAMGEATSYLKDNVNSMLYNPSSLARLRTVQMSALYQKHITEINYDALNIGMPLFGGGMGISFKAIVYPDIYENTVEKGSIIAKTKLDNISDMVFTLGFGKRIWNNLDGGVNLKYYRSSIVDYSGSAILADVGLTYSLRTYMMPAGDFHFEKEIKSYRDLDIKNVQEQYRNEIEPVQAEINEEIREIEEQVKKLDSQIKNKKDPVQQKSLEKQKEQLINKKDKLDTAKINKTKNLYNQRDKKINDLNRYYNEVLEDFKTEQKLKQMSNEGEKLHFMREVKIIKSERRFSELINNYNRQLITLENELNPRIMSINNEIEQQKENIKALQLEEKRLKIQIIQEKKKKPTNKKIEKSVKEVKEKEEENDDDEEKPETSESKLLKTADKIREKQESIDKMEKKRTELSGSLDKEIKKIEKLIDDQKTLSKTEKKRIEDMFFKSLKDEKVRNQVRLDIRQRYELKKFKQLENLNKNIQLKLEQLTKEREDLIFKRDQSLRLLKIKLKNLETSQPPTSPMIKMSKTEITRLESNYKDQITKLTLKINNFQDNIKKEKKAILVNNFNDSLKEIVDSNVAEGKEASTFSQMDSEMNSLNNRYSKILAQLEVNKQLGKKIPEALLKSEEDYKDQAYKIQEKYYNIITSKQYQESEGDVVRLREAALIKMREEFKDKLKDMDETLSTKDQDIYIEKVNFEKDENTRLIKIKYANQIESLEARLNSPALKLDERKKLQDDLNTLISKRDREIEESTVQYDKELNNYNEDILRKGNNLFFTISVLNIGSKIKYSSEETSLPLTARGGVGFYILDNLNIGAEVEREMIEERMGYYFGMEYKLLDLFPVRAGYQVGKDEGGLTLGTGVDTVVRLGLTRFNIALHYTYVPLSVFSDQHTIGLTIKKL
ncbi:MAG: hypothetical protein KKH98_08145 [Spirochaetes bacterium]|nr:hypothetical protein [Spirochaetota bacterium]